LFVLACRGGLVATEAILRGERRFKRVVALGVPFHGAWLALAALVAWITAAALCGESMLAVVMTVVALNIPGFRQVLPGSDYLKAVRARYHAVADMVECVFSEYDQVLCMRDSALMVPDKAKTALVVPEIGHAHLAFGEPAVDVLVELLRTY
jgi:hypothetical protein